MPDPMSQAKSNLGAFYIDDLAIGKYVSLKCFRTKGQQYYSWLKGAHRFSLGMQHIIGHYNSSVTASHTIHVVCIHFIFEWTNGSPKEKGEV